MERGGGVNSGHKQVKLHGSFLNYTHSSDCITDYPKIALAHYIRIPEVNGNY